MALLVVYTFLFLADRVCLHHLLSCWRHEPEQSPSAIIFIASFSCLFFSSFSLCVSFSGEGTTVAFDPLRKYHHQQQQLHFLSSSPGYIFTCLPLKTSALFLLHHLSHEFFSLLPCPAIYHLAVSAIFGCECLQRWAVMCEARSMITTITATIIAITGHGHKTHRLVSCLLPLC